MQENEEPHFDPRYALCREALLAFIAKHGRVGREQLLDAVFRTFDRAISELVHSGKVVVEKAPQNESHLDTFVMAELERP
jgi:hypothetical protein